MKALFQNRVFQMTLFAATMFAMHALGLLSPEVALGGAMVIGNLTGDTLDLAKKALSKSADDITKSITTSTGLVAYDLQAPSKNLYPVNTPLRNRIPRIGGGTGLATNWRQVNAIIGSGFDAMGWIPEGQRSARMSYNTSNKAASYVTLGEEDQVTFEGINAARTFEDIRATASMRLLQKMMLKEENAILMGNASVNLGTPATPTCSASGTGGTLPALTYSVIVVALTGEGFRGASLAGGVPLSQVITGADGQTFTLNGGSSIKSAAGSQAVGAGNTLFASTTAIQGALGYAWYVGTAGAEKLEAITTVNSVAFSAPLLGTGQAATAVTAGDKSSNPSLAFDGLLYSALKAGSGAYVKIMPTGTAGTGTPLTASSKGTINEIDVMLRFMWDNYQVSPSVIYVNSQELTNITTKALQGPSSSPLLQIFNNGEGYGNLVAGGVVGWYFNPFTMDGGSKIPVKIHPTLPAGTIIAWAEDLPAQYKSNNVPNVAEMKVRQDYYQIDWPLRTRAQEFGVYAEEVLAVYAPFAMGVITNIANG